MTAYGILRLFHVVTAVVGLGLIAAMGLVARGPAPPAALLCLSRWSGAGLGVMLLSGIAMNVLADGAFGRAWWFRLSALSLVLCGVVLGLGRRRLRGWMAGGVDPDRARRYVGRSAWAACALVGWITALMETRPF